VPRPSEQAMQGYFAETVSTEEAVLMKLMSKRRHLGWRDGNRGKRSQGLETAPTPLKTGSNQHLILRQPSKFGFNMVQQ